MRAEGCGKSRRAASDIDDDLAADVEAGEVVVVGFGNGEGVSGEDQRRFDGRHGIHAHADGGVFAQDQGSILLPRMRARDEPVSSISRVSNLTGWM